MPVTLEQIQQSADQYIPKLEAFMSKYQLKPQKLSTIGWKTNDIHEHTETLKAFLEANLIDQCHVGLVDKRYIASVVFKKPIYKNVSILKLMQRRPGSTDPVGLDHMDFAVDDLKAIEAELTKKKVPGWDYETNESHQWISVHFSGTEVKFVDHLVLDVCVKELQAMTTKLGFAPRHVQ